jgi:hypothetical protein
VNNRHPSTEAVTRFFESSHLPDPLYSIASLCESVSIAMLERLEDDPELTMGLRKLLEAKDCFVRAAVAQENRRRENPVEGAPLPRPGNIV